MKSFKNNIFYQESEWGDLILWQNKSATKKTKHIQDNLTSRLRHRDSHSSVLVFGVHKFKRPPLVCLLKHIFIKVKNLDWRKSFENNIFCQEREWRGLIIWQNKSVTTIKTYLGQPGKQDKTQRFTQLYRRVWRSRVQTSPICLLAKHVLYLEIQHRIKTIALNEKF